MTGLQGRPELRDGAQLSRDAVVEHARTASHSGEGRVRWTAGNVARLVAVVSVLGGIAVGLLYGGWSLGSDEAESQAAVREYFEAIATGEATAEAVVLSCNSTTPLQQSTSPDVAAALDADSLAGAELLVYSGQDVDGGREHDFEVRGLVRGRALLEQTDDGWRVCGLVAPWLGLVPPD